MQRGGARNRRHPRCLLQHPSQRNRGGRGVQALADGRQQIHTPRVEELARMTGIAVSTFHHRPRALASAAFAVGYQSASRFNREYRLLFGLPPMADLQTLRASSQS